MLMSLFEEEPFNISSILPTTYRRILCNIETGQVVPIETANFASSIREFSDKFEVDDKECDDHLVHSVLEQGWCKIMTGSSHLQHNMKIEGTDPKVIAKCLNWIAEHAEIESVFVIHRKGIDRLDTKIYLLDDETTVSSFIKGGHLPGSNLVN